MRIKKIDALQDALCKTCETFFNILEFGTSEPSDPFPEDIFGTYYRDTEHVLDRTLDKHHKTNYALYLLTFHPDFVICNPVKAFKARAEAGDFDPLSEDEMSHPCNLRPGREPLSDEEFSDIKAKITKEAQYWGQKPEITIAELFQNILKSQFLA